METKEKITQDFTKLHTWNGDGRNRTSGKKTTILKNKITNGFCSKCGAWKGSLGLEPTFELYIKHLCDIFDEVKRVLRNDGTCWVNLGDTYNGNKSGNTNGIYKDKIDKTKSWANSDSFNKIEQNLPSKSLCLIPFRFAIEMVNRGWICRNVIIWHKPNCMPSSVKDRFTVDFEYLFFLTKNKKYYFEQQFENLAENTLKRTKYSNSLQNKMASKQYSINLESYDKYADKVQKGILNGRNKRAVWTIPTKPFSGSHFAVYPPELIRTCIQAGCPKNGIVLDPFAGSGTTGEEAVRQGKNYILIELNPEYIKLIKKRLEGIQVKLL